jgi:hypothetical protein
MGLTKSTAARRIFLVNVIALLGTVFGCYYDDPNLVGPGGAILYRSKVDYNISFANFGDAELQDVKLCWQKEGKYLVISDAGVLPIQPPDPTRGGGKSGITIYAPTCLPETGVVRWASGSQTVRLSLPPVSDRCHFDGNVWLIYTGDRWQVVPLTKAAATYRAAHGKGVVPLELLVPGG